MNFVDLHTHSTASDGTLSPEEVAARASLLGLKAIALTDHDTVDGITRAKKAAAACSLELIPGMELFQGFRKTAAGNKFYARHIGVYAGKQTLQGSKVHAVYQSSEAYGSLKRKYNKDSGPNLTSMNDDWNYWGWSKFIRVR